MRTVTSAIVLLLLAGCASAGQPGARELSIQLVAEGQFAHVQAPAISIATTAAERSRLSTMAGKPLAGDVLVAVFMGERSTGGYAVRVDGAFVGPPPGGIVTQVITTPFAIAAIDRAALPSGPMTFLFIDGGTTVARAEAVLP
ncbi:MAG: hypothetical protein AUH85_08235 [Chloroflexi bacterium 13_1_40CM_4_68_4]|nr:MAG: hypothetical protein AUH85_08235 [Chloroflexi bacterium 13_1_40CM_4_68_4]